MTEDIRAAKAALRRAAEARRAALGVDPEAPARRLMPLLAAEAGRVLAGYWPMRGEADPRPALAAHAGPVCLPVVAGRGRPLLFRAWAPGEALVPGAFGTAVPDGGAVTTPEVLIVPLLAFDRRGFRLGYGGGFYDRTLAALRAAGRCRAIGLAFAGQEMAALPHAEGDAALDLIVTEAGVIVPAG
jgi:5-formyltetrahydrofolate cyclo-ligase